MTSSAWTGTSATSVPSTGTSISPGCQSGAGAGDFAASRSALDGRVSNANAVPMAIMGSMTAHVVIWKASGGTAT